MIFRKNLRAGTLLYALLMLGIFSLLVQFYLQSQLAAGHAWQAKKLEGQAYFMAQMARDEYLKVWEEGEEENPSLLHIRPGHLYQTRFPSPSPNPAGFRPSLHLPISNP